MSECGLCLGIHDPSEECGPKPTGEISAWEPTCPACKVTTYSGDLYMADGETLEIECGCGQRYNVTLRITYDFTSVPRPSPRADGDGE